MATFRLSYVKRYRDRHGKARFYYRRPGYPSLALPGEPGSRAFMDAYEAAQAQERRPIGADRIQPGTFSALIVDYYQSPAFQKLAPVTRRTYRNTLEAIREAIGAQPVRSLTPARMDELIAAKAHKPGALANLRKAFKPVLAIAVRRGLLRANPLDGLRLPRKPLKGFPAWSEDDIAAYEARWPTGSRQRLAMALLLYTAQRRGDVVGMGRQHMDAGGRLRVTQRKTGARLAIPVHAALAAELAHVGPAQLTFLQTQYGQPFTPAGFTNWFRDNVKAAGLPDGLGPHGLRKAASRRLAEAGCTANEIMAVTGHKNLSEVSLYTASADQAKLADSAFAKAKQRTKSSNPAIPVRQSGR